jgi:hypothetical protein
MIEKRDLLYLAVDFLLFPEQVHVLHDQLIFRLIPYIDVGFTHDEYQVDAAERMEASRPTFQSVLKSARGKVVRCLVEGKAQEERGRKVFHRTDLSTVNRHQAKHVNTTCTSRWRTSGWGGAAENLLNIYLIYSCRGNDCRPL